MFASVQISSALLTRAIHPFCELGVWVSCLRNKREREVKTHTQLTRRRKCRLKQGNKDGTAHFPIRLSCFIFFFKLLLSSPILSEKIVFRSHSRCLEGNHTYNCLNFHLKIRSQSVCSQPLIGRSLNNLLDIRFPLRLRVRADLRPGAAMICDSKFLSLTPRATLQLV